MKNGGLPVAAEKHNKKTGKFQKKIRPKHKILFYLWAILLYNIAVKGEMIFYSRFEY